MTTPKLTRDQFTNDESYYLATGHRMTDLTPDKIEALGYAAAENIERGYPKVPLASNEDTLWLVNTLGTVTAERDQARQMIADAPHGLNCAYLNTDDGWHFGDCTCWKAWL